MDKKTKINAQLLLLTGVFLDSVYVIVYTNINLLHYLQPSMFTHRILTSSLIWLHGSTIKLPATRET